MSDPLPPCPECSSPYTYGMGALPAMRPRMVRGSDIDCKVDGVGPMQLKSSVVKKA